MLRDLFRAANKRLRLSLRGLKREARARGGTARQRAELDLLGSRPNYAYGMFRAADLARFAGKRRVTVCEFGVATGNGLIAMVDLAAEIGPETGVEFRFVGFDTAAGLPRVDGYPDHPEIWSIGDFSMGDKEALLDRIDGRAEICFGDIEQTVRPFVANLDPDAPIGFISVDVDIYTATKSALNCLAGPPQFYTPAISMYFDDVSFFFANRWCGELRAIEEFNREHEHRKIDLDRSLVRRAVIAPAGWHPQMYVAHILDHELRTATQPRQGLGLQEHLKFLDSFHLR